MLLLVVGCVFYFCYSYHCLVALFSLEFLMLSVWFFLLVFLGFFGWFIFFYLVVVVCMGGVGVSILVFSARLGCGYFFFLFD